MLHEQKRTYLDLFLDNNSTPKKRTKYFEQKEEDAIIEYNNLETPQKIKNRLFENLIGPAYKLTISGVLEMPKFRRLPKALNKEDLIENTFFRLVEKTHKFVPGMISKKSGLPVKAFSYFSTVAKNFILEQITKHNKVLKNKADVETSIDLSILSEETLNKFSKTDVHEVLLDDYVTIFTSTKSVVIEIIKDLIIDEESKEKQDVELIRLGYCLKYLLEKWDKIEFVKKNEFMRILTLYTGFQQQKVSFLFKRFKIAVLKKLKPSALNKKRKLVEVDEDDLVELFDNLIPTEDEDEIDIDIELDDTLVLPEVEETEEEKIMKYEVSSMEDFDSRELKLENVKIRDKWRKKIKK
ncbi:MAG: hypothetical protein ABIP51_17140 [Bacteroidia bacterium]